MGKSLDIYGDVSTRQMTISKANLRLRTKPGLQVDSIILIIIFKPNDFKVTAFYIGIARI